MLLTCCFVYGCAYFCRVNLSISIPYLQAEFGWDKAVIGLIASSFFWAYAIGQLLNGVIGDRFGPRYFVAVGLVVAGVANILMSKAASLASMLVLWGINGYFQSMLWGPIVRTVSVYTPKEKQSLMVVLLSFAMVFGYLGSYAAVSRLATLFTWRHMFLLPGCLLAVTAVVWVWMLRDFKKDSASIMKTNAENSEEPEEIHPLKEAGPAKLIWRSRLYIVALICVMQGIMREGIVLWGPTFLSESQHMDFQSALNILSIVPITNLCGTFATGFLNKKFRYREKRTLAMLFVLCGIFAGGLYLFAPLGAAVPIVFFCLLSAMVFGANSVLTTIIPLNFRPLGRVSTAAGFVDCAVYIGAAISGPLLGMIADWGGWGSVILLWIGAAVISIALSLWSSDYKAGIPA